MSKTDSEPKKAKIESKSDVSDNDVNDSEEDLTWEDVICLYCDQRVAIHRDKPGQNKKKYQTHLLTHFYDTQYSDIPEGLRMYQCCYKDCDYGAGSKNNYIQHIAFKHDEWYRRINKRIAEALSDPEVAEELEDLSAVKEAFVTDYNGSDITLSIVSILCACCWTSEHYWQIQEKSVEKTCHGQRIHCSH